MTAEWTSYRLIPDDLLFFRDGRPSTIGEDHFLQSIFPLHPATLYGAVRTARLVEEGEDLSGLNAARWGTLSPELRSEIGEWGSFGTLELRGPWLERDGALFFPAPADLGVFTEQTTRAGGRHPSRVVTNTVRFRPDSSAPAGAWAHDYRPLRPYVRDRDHWTEWKGDTPESPSGWFLTASGIQSWLAGDVPAPGDFEHSSALWHTEIRSGVGLEDSSRTAKKGSLYTFGFIRLATNVSIGFELRHGSLGCPGRLRLGGEGKTARVETGVPLTLSLPGGGAALRTIYLATPAFSVDGSRAPAAVSGSVSAAVRGSALVGGWDLARSGPKPLRRAIPAGSVYFAPEAVSLAQLHGRNISDITADQETLQGFGLSFIGISH